MIEFLLGFVTGGIVYMAYTQYRIQKAMEKTSYVQVGYLQKRSRGRPKKVV